MMNQRDVERRASFPVVNFDVAVLLFPWLTSMRDVVVGVAVEVVVGVAVVEVLDRGERRSSPESSASFTVVQSIQSRPGSSASFTVVNVEVVKVVKTQK